MFRFRPQTLVSGLIVGVLTLFVIAVAIINFEPGTWLSGWDNLHPEFNFYLNVKRSLSAVWQEYQGVGLLGGMSHGADLPRQLILWALSVVLPAQILRYVWTFGMVWLGAVGAYFLLLNLLNGSARQFWMARRLSAATGALFYLFNLATVQNFYVPYETFSTFYGFLPWLLLATLNVFQKASPRNLWLLLIIALLASPAFYVQTLFVVYTLIVAIFSIETLIRDRVAGLKKVTAAGLILLAANAFWLIPNLYFTLTNSAVTVNAKINQLATPEVQFMNQNRGGLMDIALLRGYWYDYIDSTPYDPGQGYRYLLEAWRLYAQEPYAWIAGLIVFCLAVIGMVILAFKAHRWRLALPLLFVICILMLTTGLGVLGWPFSFLSEHVPLFGQMFRTAFTKWSIATALLYAVGLSFSSYALMRLSLKVTRALVPLIIFTFSVLILVPVIPTFQGQFIDKFMKLEQPAVYQNLFTFFQTQPKERRIAFLPVHSFWGWNFYSWEYRGSGFLWYGIEQPILDRAFDVWSPYNETFYYQLSTAVYANDLNGFYQVLDQYDVSYLILDESITSADQPDQALRKNELKTMLTRIRAEEVFSEGFIHVYELPQTPNHFIYSPPTATVVDNSQLFQRIDPAYQQLGNYLSPTAENSLSVIYPFSDLYQEKTSGITFEENSVHFTSTIPEEGVYDLEIPRLATGSPYTTTVSLYYRDDQVYISFPETTEITSGNQKVSLPRLNSVRLPIAKPTQTLIVELNDQAVEVTRQAATTSAQLTLTVGTPLTYQYYDKTAIRQVNDQVSVNSTDVETGVLNSQLWQDFDRNQRLTLDHASEIRVTVSTIPHLINPNDQGNFSQCDIFNRGSIKKTPLVSGTIYEAFNYASICEGVDLPNLNTRRGYILRWQGENKEGRSPKFFLQNQSSHRADLENVLPSGPFDSTYSVLGWPTLSDAGYSLNWETRAYGSLTSENKVKTISFYPLPLDQIASLRLIPTSGMKLFNSPAELNNYWKKGTFSYGFTAKVTADSSPVVLSQGFDQGWLAVRIPEDFRQITRYHLLEHWLFNGWANSWLLPQGEYQVIIFYWPQLLAFAGFGLLGITFSISTVMLVKRRSGS